MGTLRYRRLRGSDVDFSQGGIVKTVNNKSSDSAGNINLLAVDKDFTNGDLVNGKLKLVHNLGKKFVTVQVWDNLGEPVLPDKIAAADLNTTTVTLISFQPFTDSWHITIS